MKPLNVMFIGLSLILFSIAILVGIEGILFAPLDKPGEYIESCCILWFIAVACLMVGAD